MLTLLRWLLGRRWRREAPRVVLTLLGVALGVSVFVAVRLANHSAMASFADTVDAVTGRANLQVAATADGFDEHLYRKIRRQPGVIAAAPVVEVNALAAAGPPRTLVTSGAVEVGQRQGYDETLLVLGLDPFVEAPFARFSAEADSLDMRSALALFAEPGAIAITRALAERHQLHVGDTLTVLASGAATPLRIEAILKSEALQQAMGGNVVLADIATVQEVFARGGRLDRVDLIVTPRDRDRVGEALARWLPAGAAVQQPQTRTRQVENMVRAFSLNLLALSFIALFVSTFLIFNAVALAVVRQRRDIGILRALGLTRGQVVTVFLVEGLLLGTIGGVLGTALGALLARVTLVQVGRTLTALYLVAQANKLWLDPLTLAGGVAIGIVAALASALGPALEAAGTSPAATLREGQRIEAGTVPYARLAVGGIVALLAAGAVTAWTISEHHAGGGFVSAFLLLVAFSLVAPAWTLAAERLASPVARKFGIAATLGARSVRETAARASVVIAAIMVAVGMLVALTIMVGSFRHTVDTWITQTLRGDLYIEPVGHRASGHATALPPELVEGARKIPGVAAVDTYRASTIVMDGRLATAVGIDFHVQRDFNRLQFTSRETARDVLGRALAHDGVVVTESFAQHHRVRKGDRITLPVPGRAATVPVEGVFYDYSTDAGAVLMDRALYARLWHDDRTESMALYLAPGAQVDAVRAAFVRLAGPSRLLYVTPNQALRNRVLSVFDETFQITWALQTIAVIVSVLGVISTLTTLVVQRRRELAVLRATGATRGQVRALVLVESGVLGAAGSLLGCVAGFALALVLVHVINRQFFGWSIRMTVEPLVFVRAVVLMTATATLAGLVPARLAAGRGTAAALRIE